MCLRCSMKRSSGQKTKSSSVMAAERLRKQALTSAHQRLHAWEAIQPLIEAAHGAQHALAAAKQALQATRNSATEQAVLDCQQAADGAELAVHNAEQAVAQNPPGNYAPIPNSP